MKYYNDCPNCGSSNPLFKLTCGNCKTFLRAKVTNIDFGSILWQLMEEPKKAFIKIIQAEHKNFTIPTLLAVTLKISLTIQIISNIILAKHSEVSTFFLSLGVTYLISIIIFLFLPFLIKLLGKIFKREYRYKDILTIITFSFVPMLISLIIFVPLEFALFGAYWFLFNPPPTLIKPIPSYILFFFEFCFFAWNLILMVISQNRLYDKKWISIIATTIFFSLLFGGSILTNLYLF
ncbi:MAG: Yip1 family protein [Melioribacteraceae bacterium]|nr:YIP1 family protein [Melioribacteraceae bacterium]MDD3559141.1 Yip1 family protein [Melioribacteraceae bacterium]